MFICLGLGSNLGNAETNLVTAIDYIKNEANVQKYNSALTKSPLSGAKISAVSPIYLTSPLGNENQPFFLNCVIILDLPESSYIEYKNEDNYGEGFSAFFQKLLASLKAIEKKMGRQESSERFMPRIIDIDILFAFNKYSFNKNSDKNFESLINIDLPDLKIPHKEIFNRLFVLIPISDILNESDGYSFQEPFDKESIKKALAKLKKTDAGALQKISYYAKFDENLRIIAR